MIGNTQKRQPHSIVGKMEIPYHNYVGKLASDFYVKLRDDKKITGTRCDKCGKVYVPPKSVCGLCFSKLDSLVEVSSTGTLLTFTEVTYKEPVQPLDPPIVYGVVLLDGADTGMVHMVGEADPSDIKIGMRVVAVFKEKGEGNILDIKYFKPA